MNIFGKKFSSTLQKPNTSVKGNKPAPVSTGESTGTEKKSLQTQTPASPRATQNTAAPVAPRPLRTWVIKHMPACIRRHEAKKHAPQAADLQMSKILQAVKEGKSDVAKTAASDLKAALVPLLSKKPNASNHEQLMATFMGKQLPSQLKDLQTLRQSLRQLESNAELELLSFVVEANMLKLQADLFQNGALKTIDRLFFDPYSHTEVNQLNVTQLEALSQMDKLAEPVAKRAESLSRDNKIPGTELTASTAKLIAARTDAAKQLLQRRDVLLSPNLDDLSMMGLKTLKAATTLWLKNTPKDAPRDEEMYARDADALNAILEREEAELQAAHKKALLAQECKATSTDALNKLLSDTDKWFNNAPKDAPRDPEMQAMYQRALTNRDLARARAEKLTDLLTRNVDNLRSKEALEAFMNELGTLSKLVPMDEAQQDELAQQQVNAINRITDLEDEINKKKRTQ